MGILKINVTKKSERTDNFSFSSLVVYRFVLVKELWWECFLMQKEKKIYSENNLMRFKFIEQLIPYWKPAFIYWLFSGQAVHVTIRLFQMEWKYQFWLFGYLFHRIPNKADKGQNSILAQMGFWFETWVSLQAKRRVVSLLKTELDTTLLGLVVTICNFSERSF